SCGPRLRARGAWNSTSGTLLRSSVSSGPTLRALGAVGSRSFKGVFGSILNWKRGGPGGIDVNNTGAGCCPGGNGPEPSAGSRTGAPGPPVPGGCGRPSGEPPVPELGVELEGGTWALRLAPIAASTARARIAKGKNGGLVFVVPWRVRFIMTVPSVASIRIGSTSDAARSSTVPDLTRGD